MPGPALEAKGISKRFGATQALDRVTLSFRPGEIAAVLGENGAGKSTLMSIFAGQLQPDAGVIELDGQEVVFHSPSTSRKHGIEMVHQHFMLVPEFTVEENLALSRLDRLARRADPGRLAAPSMAKARELGWESGLAGRTSELPVGIQQRVEILKALGGDARILIFDEPTAVLSPGEVDELFRVLRQLKAEGRTVILIAHKLSEVMAISDRVAVLRRGKLVAESPTSEVDEKTLATWMVGELPTALRPLPPSGAEPALAAKGLFVQGDRGEESVRGLDLEVRPGEILGIGGVDGNGQVELAEALAGIRPISGGQLLWKGVPIDRSGVRMAYIPQDRHADGLALRMSVLDNLLAGGYRERSIGWGPFLWPPKVRQWGIGLASRFAIKLDGVDEPAASLSGGNQQKVVVARSLAQEPELLVASNPSRGLDVGATGAVHRSILDAARSGTAVVLFSADADELATLSSRTVFMSRGRLTQGAGAEAWVGGAS